MEDSQQQQPEFRFGDVQQFGSTVYGDINLNSMRTPPPDAAMICPVERCRAPNWEHAPYCPSCGYDFRHRSKLIFRGALIALLLLIAALLGLILQRI